MIQLNENLVSFDARWFLTDGSWTTNFVGPSFSCRKLISHTHGWRALTLIIEFKLNCFLGILQESAWSYKRIWPLGVLKRKVSTNKSYFKIGEVGRPASSFMRVVKWHLQYWTDGMIADEGVRSAQTIRVFAAYLCLFIASGLTLIKEWLWHRSIRLTSPRTVISKWHTHVQTFIWSDHLRITCSTHIFKSAVDINIYGRD